MYVMQRMGVVQSAVRIAEGVMGGTLVILALIIVYLVRVGKAFY